MNDDLNIIFKIKAQLYHTFAASSGEINSLMSLGYRKLYGIGTPKNCEESAKHYQAVASKGK